MTALATEPPASSEEENMSEENNKKEEMMSEESNNARTSDERSVADDNKKLSEDARGLGPMDLGSVVIGLVDEIVGEGGVEVPGCVATKYELIQIVKHWAAEIIDLDFSYFAYGCTGSSEWRIHEYAKRRLNTIAKSIGEEEAGKAVQEAHAEFAKNIDLRTWNIFVNGTADERQALQDEIAREMRGADSKEVARISELMRSLGLDYPVAEAGKSVRFAILPSFTAAAVADPRCIIAPILHYLNASANDGHYKKDVDGSFPPIHWEARHLGISPMDMKQIQKLADSGEAASDFDIVMTHTDPACGHEFRRAANKARWQLNPELVIEVEKAAGEISNALGTKLAGRAGVTIFDNFQLASIPTPDLNRVAKAAQGIADEQRSRTSEKALPDDDSQF